MSVATATLDPFISLPGLHPYHAALQIIGTIGCIIYVGGYLLVQSGRICGNSVGYSTSKLAAASFVLASLLTSFNLAAFLIQISFIAISLYGIWYRLSGRISARRDRSGAARMRVSNAALTPVMVHSRPRRKGMSDKQIVTSLPHSESHRALIERKPRNTAIAFQFPIQEVGADPARPAPSCK